MFNAEVFERVMGAIVVALASEIVILMGYLLWGMFTGRIH